MDCPPRQGLLSWLDKHGFRFSRSQFHLLHSTLTAVDEKIPCDDFHAIFKAILLTEEEADMRF